MLCAPNRTPLLLLLSLILLLFLISTGCGSAACPSGFYCAASFDSGVGDICLPLPADAGKVGGPCLPNNLPVRDNSTHVQQQEGCCRPSLFHMLIQSVTAALLLCCSPQDGFLALYDETEHVFQALLLLLMVVLPCLSVCLYACPSVLAPHSREHLWSSPRLLVPRWQHPSAAVMLCASPPSAVM